MFKVAGAAAILWLALVITYVVAAIQGLIMCFKASIVIGLVGLFLGAPWVLEAVAYWFTGYDIALHLAKALGLP